jgi:uncharacterized repeat protein (TIGR02543 family)
MMVRFGKILICLTKHSKWLCLLALAFCVCTDAPEYCGPGRQLNAHTEFCFDGEVYQKCGGNDYNPYTEFCYNRVRYQLCNGHEYNPARDFCDNNLMYPMCEGRDYNPQTHGCVFDMLRPRCGANFYNPAAEFCSNEDSRVYDLCNGQPFNLAQGCGGASVLPKCGDVDYDPAGDLFCFNNELHNTCGGSEYNIETHECSRGQVLPISYTLTINANPAGSGTILPSGATTHNSGARVTVTATAATGYRFTGWSGAATSVNPTVVVTMTGNMTLTANFHQSSTPGSTMYTLTTNAFPAAGGSVTRSPNQTSYSHGSVVTITAAAASSDYRFVSWTGLVANAGSATTTVSMTANRAVTANFEWAGDGPGPTPGIYTLTTNVSPANSGTITRIPNQMTFFGGSVVTVTATPVPWGSFRFTGWSGGVSDASSATTTVSMTADMTVIANFEPGGVVVPDINIEMVFVHGGTFWMGCTPEQSMYCEDSEKPPHQVTLSSFYIGKYPVTQAQWIAVMGNNPSHFTGDTQRPVEQVSWNNIVNQFIPRLNEMTGMTYRLPTEAEWEFAARGGTNTRWHIYSGSDNINEVACRGSSTCPVGTKAPNELGIYDMSGNVSEWVSDWFGSYTAEVKTNPAGPSSGSSRVFRGGSWTFVAEDCRVSARHFTPGYHGPVGFRLAVSSSP